MYRVKILIAVIFVSAFLSGSTVNAGLSGTLDKELTSLIEKTKPYLVTVKGDGDWRNLIATGIVYNEEGYVITSSLAYLASDFEVTFANGETYKAEPVGADHATGLALLKIKGKREFQIPVWGSVSGMKDGDWVLFVGNSYDKPSSVNIGTYSGKDDDGFLELNLNVNPGSSGGAVLNTDGEVIGILVAKQFSPYPELLWSDMKFKEYHFLSRTEKSGESALALGIDQAKDIAKQLMEHGEIKRGFLGISQRNLTDSEKEENDIDAGVMITDVVADSPAEDAGLKEDDIIIEIDGKKIGKTGDLYRKIRSHKPGDEITVTYIRDGKTGEIDVELSESKSDYFLGSLDSREMLPKLLINNKLDLPKTEDLESKLEKLQDRLEELELEFDRLKSGVRE